MPIDFTHNLYQKHQTGLQDDRDSLPVDHTLTLIIRVNIHDSVLCFHTELRFINFIINMLPR